MKQEAGLIQPDNLLHQDEAAGRLAPASFLNPPLQLKGLFYGTKLRVDVAIATLLTNKKISQFIQCLPEAVWLPYKTKS